MNNTLKNVLIFAGGAAVGATASYFVTKKIVIDHIIKHFEEEEQQYEALSENESETDIVEELDQAHMDAIVKRKELNKADVTNYADMIRTDGYIDYSKFSEKEQKTNIEKGQGDESNEEVDEEVKIEIRAVTEEYFDDLSDEDYRFVGFSLFNDGIIADENNEKIDFDELEDTVGTFWIDDFKESSEDSFYIVNDRLNVAYEIIKDLRNYADVAEARGE